MQYIHKYEHMYFYVYSMQNVHLILFIWPTWQWHFGATRLPP